MTLRFSAAALAVFLGITLIAIPARADSPLNTLFPWLFGPPDEGPKPEDTLQAPFGKKPSAGQDQTGLMKMYEDEQGDGKNEGGLEIAHRSPEQVGEWVSSVATQALTIDPDTFVESSKRYEPYFAPYALQEYKNYLATRKMPDVLKQNNMKLTAFAESEPVLVQEGVLEGTYRWLFRVPVMLTYYDRVTKSLKGQKKPVSQSQRVMVNVQIGRVPSNQLADGMAIERWTVTAN